MTFSIRLSPKAAKALEKLPEKTAERVRKRLLKLQHEPERQLKRLKGYDTYSLRIGEYRALIDMQNDMLLVRVIGHRKNIYKRS